MKFTSNIKITTEPLSQNTIFDAELLRDEVFNDIPKEEKPLLKASLDPVGFEDVYLENDVVMSKYWVLKDKTSSKIIGLSGIYQESGDKSHECWLGWFCLDKKYRKQHLGKELLSFSIEMAKKEGYKTMNVYTYNTKKYLPARNLYKSFDFKECKIRESRYKKDIFLQKNI